MTVTRTQAAGVERPHFLGLPAIDLFGIVPLSSRRSTVQKTAIAALAVGLVAAHGGDHLVERKRRALAAFPYQMGSDAEVGH